MPNTDPNAGPILPRAETLAELKQAMALAGDGRLIAGEMRRTIDRLNDLFRDAALLGLKVEFEIGESFLNTLVDENAGQPTAYIKCRIFEEVPDS